MLNLPIKYSKLIENQDKIISEIGNKFKVSDLIGWVVREYSFEYLFHFETDEIKAKVKMNIVRGIMEYFDISELIIDISNIYNIVFKIDENLASHLDDIIDIKLIERNIKINNIK